MARYKLTSEGHFNDAFKLISVERTDNDGIVTVVPKNQELFSAIVPAGAVVEVPDKLIPGQHMQPLDEAARKVCAAYPEAANPAQWNTLEGLPNTMDMRSTEQMVADAMTTAIQAAFKAGQQQAQADPPKLSLGGKR